MVARCYNPKASGYEYYGGRRITVCDAWHDIAAFVAWMEANLGPRPPGHTLDRIDNDRGYGPGNVQWASHRTQGLNRNHDGMRKGSAKTFAKLTEGVVRECRRRYAAGEFQDDLAVEFGVSKPTMHKAIVGKTWRHV